MSNVIKRAPTKQNKKQAGERAEDEEEKSQAGKMLHNQMPAKYNAYEIMYNCCCCCCIYVWNKILAESTRIQIEKKQDSKQQQKAVHVQGLVLPTTFNVMHAV